MGMVNLNFDLKLVQNPWSDVQPDMDAIGRIVSTRNEQVVG